MSIYRYIGLASLLVSGLGLTSCRKDAHPEPSRVAHRHFSGPRVVRQSVSYDLESWGRESDRNLKLGESIELPSPPPRFTEVHATCGEGRRAFTHRAVFENARELPVFKFLPEELLARNLNKSPVGCNFIIQLGDDPRDRSGFEMFATITGDHGAIHISGRGVEFQSPAKLRTKDLLGHSISFPSATDAEAQLVCTELTFPTVAFNGEIDLTDLRVERAHVRADADPKKIVTERPDQTCRVVVSRKADKVREEMTELFTLRFNQERWAAKTVTDTSIKSGVMLPGESFTLASYYISNLEDETLRLRFNKDAFNGLAAMNVVWDPNGISTVAGPPLIRIFRDGPINMAPLGPGEEISLPPHTTQKFNLVYLVGGDVHCNHVRVRFKLNDKVVLQDLNKDGNVVNGVTLDPPEEWITKVQFQPNFVFDPAQARYLDGGCYW